MKNIICIIFFILCWAFLFSQVNFELDFSFEKIDSNDQLKNLQLFDYNDDGEDEVIAFFSYDYNNFCRLVCYNQSGDTLLTHLVQMDSQEDFLNGCMFQNQNEEKFIVITSWLDEDWEFSVSIYSFDSFALIDSISFDTLSYYIAMVYFIHVEQYEEDILIYIGAFGGLPGSSSAVLYKVLFSNEILTFIEFSDDCGLRIIKYQDCPDLIITGYNYDEIGGPSVFQVCKLYLVSNELYSSFQQLFHISGSVYCGNPAIYYNWPGSIEYITVNDNHFDVYGLIVSYNIYDTNSGNSVHFKCFDPDFSGTIWNKDDTQIGMESVLSSTCVDVNGEDNYVMYFRENQLEIRDRINGDIFHYQTSTINPFEIKRINDGELLFFVEQDDETGYDVYVLDGEIQVSADINLLPVPEFQLLNFPNPFNPETTIKFTAENAETYPPWRIEIYNIKGQKVKTLECINRVNAKTTRSFYSITWNGMDENSNPVSSGIYFYKLKAGNFSQTKKMLLLR